MEGFVEEAHTAPLDELAQERMSALVGLGVPIVVGEHAARERLLRARGAPLE